MKRFIRVAMVVVAGIAMVSLAACASAPTEASQAQVATKPATEYVATAPASYDSMVVKAAMGKLVGALQKVNPALGSGDFATAAMAFGDISAAALSIKDHPSPDGDQATWTATLMELSTAALEGKTAAGASDLVASRAAFQKVIAAQQNGHGTFR